MVTRIFTKIPCGKFTDLKGGVSYSIAKRILLSLLFFMTGTFVHAYDFEVDGIYYTCDSNHMKATVTSGGTEYSGNVDIPSTVTYGGKIFNVTTIGEGAFRDCSRLTSVTIPNGVTKIGDLAFNSCIELKTITIPNSVTSIGGAVFGGCSSLTSITIPEGITSIESATFHSCYNLKTITIPNSVTSIGGAAFQGCSSLTSIKIPKDVNSIGQDAFLGCSSLTSVTIPDGITYLEQRVFGGCSSLTSITIPDGVTSIGPGAFKSCTSLTSVIIPNSVNCIEFDAFKNCTSLASITIPNSVNRIMPYAFWDCTSLTSVTIPYGVTAIEGGVFYGCTSLTSVTIPNSVTEFWSNAFYGCTSLTSITIPNSVTSIGGGAFYGCTSLKSVTIPNSVTKIGDNAFSNCPELKSVYISTGVTNAGCSNIGSAFNDVKDWNKFILDDSVEIKDMIFWDSDTYKMIDTLYLGAKCNSMETKAFSVRPVILIIGQNFEDKNNNLLIREDSLQVIYSKIMEPEAIEEFSFYTYADVPLYVPIGTKSLYESVEGWKQFSLIIEMDMSQLTQKNVWAGYITNSPTSIDDVLENTNAEPDTYYSIDGKRLSTLQNGINIVKMTDGTYKKFFVKE